MNVIITRNLKTQLVDFTSKLFEQFKTGFVSPSAYLNVNKSFYYIWYYWFKFAQLWISFSIIILTPYLKFFPPQWLNNCDFNLFIYRTFSYFHS